MKTIEEIRDWLLENAVDNEGDLILSELDLSNFDGNVYIYGMKVKKSLHQNFQKVGEDLWQNGQIVRKDLHQDCQDVGESLWQDHQKVGEEFYNHKLNKNEYWEEKEFYVVRRNKLKEITLEELEKIGFKLKEEK